MLLDTWLGIVADWKPVFIQNRTACRARNSGAGDTRMVKSGSTVISPWS